ncbi:MAG TPA: folylpolyglutamate synthase/dihydrofolate synthase family protein, partial [Thermodesulfovibrionales bacterium]|nr:folylpolyglutamate synthase/dihydrofolate synthase family protein [Thermodesulfovibrionales bacterium]
MSYDETIAYLYSLQKYGIKFGLENIRKLSSALGNPHKSFQTIHVAGTNGKGSTSAIIASILQSSGMRVGLFTSPHLISFTERIRINSEQIPEEVVVRLASEIKDIASRCEDLQPTFFKVVTAIALLWFQRQKVDTAVMEVGMGGRLDATNIIEPLVSVITDISIDHKDFLGSTLGEIAREKAGIIKNGVPVVSSDQGSEAAEVIIKAAKATDSPLYLYGRDFSASLKDVDESGTIFDYSDGPLQLKDLFVPLPGEHQTKNSSIAIKAATIFLDSIGVHSQSTLRDLIRNGLESTKWPGRAELIRGNPCFLIDGAHNPAAANALAETIKKVFLKKYKKIIMVLGIMSDKDIQGIMKPLLPLASDIVLTAP